MKIAHYVPQTIDRFRAMDWQNMLGACPGNEGESPQNQTCDTRQGNQTLHPFLNPCQSTPSVESLLLYTTRGELRAIHQDPAVRQALQEDLGEPPDATGADRGGKLNLNRYRLMENRREVLDLLRIQLGATKGAFRRSELERALGEWTKVDENGRLHEYCQVAVFFLGKWMRKAP